MKRRQFVVRGTSSGFLSFLAGCGGVLESGGINLEVRNRDSETHSYEITNEYYEDRKASGKLGSDETDTVENILPYEDYTHRVDLAISVDGTRVHEWAILVETDVHQMSVEITGAESVEVRPENFNSPTPSAE